ncbi:MAG: hypothetical protein IT378_03880 [Sandaracinaceae bacterium]|nr:hypothetical protein [Sandaracinaceae bacterium]
MKLYSTILFLLVSACGGSETTASNTASNTAPGPTLDRGTQEQWLGIAAYPGARHLCSQHVTGAPGPGSMHIQWSAYASPDPIERARAFYERTRGTAAIEDDGPSFRLRINADDVISAHPVGASYPTCEVAPSASDRTYFVVSHATR